MDSNDPGIGPIGRNHLYHMQLRRFEIKDFSNRVLKNSVSCRSCESGCPDVFPAKAGNQYLKILDSPHQVRGMTKIWDRDFFSNLSMVPL
jgi:hypothetical protein